MGEMGTGRDGVQARARTGCGFPIDMRAPFMSKKDGATALAGMSTGDATATATATAVQVRVLDTPQGAGRSSGVPSIRDCAIVGAERIVWGDDRTSEEGKMHYGPRPEICSIQRPFFSFEQCTIFCQNG